MSLKISVMQAASKLLTLLVCISMLLAISPPVYASSPLRPARVELPQSNDAGTFPVSGSQAALSPQSTSITYGQTVTGTITTLGQVVTYAFIAGAGDVVVVGLSDDGWLAPQVRLYAPDGSLLASTWSTGSHVEVTYTLSSPGSYTFLVSDYYGTAIANYGVFVQRLNGASNATPIMYGQTLTDTITLLAEAGSYRFTAGAGDVVVVGLSDDGGLAPQVRLYAPDGSLLASTWSTGSHVEVTHTLSSPGSYTFLVSDYYGTAIANYGVFVQRLNGGGVNIVYLPPILKSHH